jgi:hypothetical protein
MFDKINRVGTIIRGDAYAGWKIRVEKEQRDSGGYLILIWSEASDQGFDGWVGSAEELEPYFREAGWDIRWEG